MTDRIDFGGEPWQAIPRRVLRDPKLTYRAKGGLVALLSHEEGWVRSAIATLMHEGNCGRKQAQAIMAELRAAGYAEFVKEKGGRGNLVKSRYVIYAIPKGATFQPSLVNPSDLPETGTSSSRSTGARAAVVEALDVDPLDVEPKDQNLAPAPRTREPDPIFEALCQIQDTDWHDITTVERGRLNKAAKALRDIGVDPKEIPRRAEAWAKRFPGATLTALALVAHWGELNGQTRIKSDLLQRIELEEMYRG